MKRCPKCGEQKAASEYFKNKNAKDGLGSVCKICHSAAMKAHRSKPETRVKEREAQNAWRAANPDKVAATAKRWNQSQGFRDAVARYAAAGKFIPVFARYRASAKGKAAMKRIREKYPEKHSARKAVSHAVKVGKLKRGPCQECGATPAQGHHHNGYSKPHRLDVVWLCAKCHHKADHAPR